LTARDQFKVEMPATASARDIVLQRGWLGRLPDSFQRAVVDRCVLRKYRAGAWIYRRGDPPGGLYGVVRGSLAVDIAPEGRGPYLGYFMRPGSWFGEVPLFTGGPRLVSLRAARATELLYLPLHAVNAIVGEDSSAWRYFGLLSLAHVEILSSAIDDLLRRDHTKRFVAMLLHMGDCRLASPANAGPIEIDVGQKELAILANVARTTAGAILRELEQAGHIDLSYRLIRIVSPDALRALLVRRGPATKSARLLQPNVHRVDFAAKTKPPPAEVRKRSRRP
jgi:CRP/FNR family cyclic AMP-dependent transcriptional regulator